MLVKILAWLGLTEIRCAVCTATWQPQETNFASLRICPACQKSLGPYCGPRCPLCGVPWRGICQQCAKSPPPWDGFGYYGLYTSLLRDQILRLKFSAELHLTPVLGEFLLEAAKNLPRPDLLLGVPQFPAHLRKRGFNQAHELAKFVARAGGWQLAPHLLRRIKSGPPQEGLSAIERRENLQNAFGASPLAQGKIIWLIDDVLTTGSTCAAAATALKESGAKAVYLLFVARTPF